DRPAAPGDAASPAPDTSREAPETSPERGSRGTGEGYPKLADHDAKPAESKEAPAAPPGPEKSPGYPRLADDRPASEAPSDDAGSLTRTPSERGLDGPPAGEPAGPEQPQRS